MHYHLPKCILTVVCLFIGLLFANSLHAATVSVQAPESIFNEKDTFYVDILLDPEGEAINALDMEFTFSDDIVSIESLSDSTSIVSTWVDRPAVSGNAVVFSGIIPGGFSGLTDPLTKKVNPGTVLRVYLEPKKAGVGRIEMTRGLVYKHDGLGTEYLAQFSPFSFGITEGVPALPQEAPDTTPPEEFTPSIVTDTDLYGGAFTIIFDTKDKGSGIAYYEVKEGNLGWIRALSPYRLTDQSLTSTISVRAVDEAGNERIAVLRGPKQFPASIFLVPFSILTILFFVLLKWYRKYTHAK